MTKKITALTALLLTLIMLLSSVPVGAATLKSVPKNFDYHYGIDVSKWNGSLNVEQIKKHHVEFAIIRIGTFDKKGGHLDIRFKENVKKMVENGIEFGVYVYSYVYKKSDNEKCAKWVHNELKKLGNYTKDRDTIPVAYDIEDDIQVNAVLKGKITVNYLQQSVMKFCSQVKNYGYIPVVYSFESFFNDCLKLDNFQENGVKIWYARWPHDLNTKVPKVLGNGTIPEIWQYSSTFTIGGKPFDSNVCYDDLYDYANEDSKLTVKNLKTSYKLKKGVATPDLKVYDGNKLLKQDADYKLFFFKNDRAGKATAKIVRFKNKKYQETKTVNFYIAPTPVTGISYTTNASEINFSWKKPKGATGFAIYEYDNTDGTYNRIDTITETEYVHFDLDEATNYKLRIRAFYKTKDNKEIKSNYTELNLFTKYKKLTNVTGVSEKKKKALISWQPKTTDCTGYEIEYSQKSTFTNTIVFNVDSAEESSHLFEGLKSGKTYYFRVRSYNLIGDTVVHSTFSKTVKVTIK